MAAASNVPGTPGYIPQQYSRIAAPKANSPNLALPEINEDLVPSIEVLIQITFEMEPGAARTERIIRLLQNYADEDDFQGGRALICKVIQERDFNTLRALTQSENQHLVNRFWSKYKKVHKSEMQCIDLLKKLALAIKTSTTSDSRQLRANIQAVLNFLGRFGSKGHISITFCFLYLLKEDRSNLSLLSVFLTLHAHLAQTFMSYQIAEVLSKEGLELVSEFLRILQKSTNEPDPKFWEVLFENIANQLLKTGLDPREIMQIFSHMPEKLDPSAKNLALKAIALDCIAKSKTNDEDQSIQFIREAAQITSEMQTNDPKDRGHHTLETALAIQKNQTEYTQKILDEFDLAELIEQATMNSQTMQNAAWGFASEQRGEAFVELIRSSSEHDIKKLASSTLSNVQKDNLVNMVSIFSVDWETNRERILDTLHFIAQFEKPHLTDVLNESFEELIEQSALDIIFAFLEIHPFFIQRSTQVIAHHLFERNLDEAHQLFAFLSTQINKIEAKLWASFLRFATNAFLKGKKTEEEVHQWLYSMGVTVPYIRNPSLEILIKSYLEKLKTTVSLDAQNASLRSACDLLQEMSDGDINNKTYLYLHRSALAIQEHSQELLKEYALDQFLEPDASAEDPFLL